MAIEKRLPISVALISGAEAHRIGRALASVAGWATEIVVVLNEEARDGTEEIAHGFDARVFREPWRGYLAQKNAATARAACDWILNLDADEVVSEELCREIRALLAGGSRLAQFAAFSMPRLSWYCGRWIRHGDWHPDRQTRLWRRGQARWAGIDPHPYLEVDGAIGKLHGHLHHFSTESINQRLQKIIPFSDEFVRQRASGLGRPGLFTLAGRPAWRFFRAYFLKLGFLDGWQGYYLAMHSAFSTLVRYAKVRERLPANPSSTRAPPSPPPNARS